MHVGSGRSPAAVPLPSCYILYSHHHTHEKHPTSAYLQSPNDAVYVSSFDHQKPQSHHKPERTDVVYSFPLVLRSLFSTFQLSTLRRGVLCLNYQVSLQNIFLALSRLICQIEVNRAANLVKAFAAGKIITSVETNEDTIVYSGISHADFVRLELQPHGILSHIYPGQGSYWSDGD